MVVGPPTFAHGPEVTTCNQGAGRSGPAAATTLCFNKRCCSECQLFGRSVGLGGTCPDCDSVILLADLLGLELRAPS
jgi:hypothetical protein